jgi:acetyl-CoA carboxylase carboxyl transferase subunit alpha
MVALERPIVELEKRIAELKQLAALDRNLDVADEIRELEEQVYQLRVEAYSDIDPWERTQISRHPQRPYTLDYVGKLCTEWTELHGDRLFMDDPPIVGGLARFDGEPVVIIGQQKGRNTKENLLRNFGMPRPEGYRKALRLMDLAERFNRPILTFIDTAGAYPGIEAEARGQAEAIAKNVLVMSKLKVPIIVSVIGEGGSGGALAIGVGNRVIMLENSGYSVISPESCAAILWHDQAKAPQAAHALKYSAQDCLRLGVADEIIPEPPGGAHLDFDGVVKALGESIRRHLQALRKLTPEQLADDRYERFRKLGAFLEPGAARRSGRARGGQRA